MGFHPLILIPLIMVLSSVTGRKFHWSKLIITYKWYPPPLTIIILNQNISSHNITNHCITVLITCQMNLITSLMIYFITDWSLFLLCQNLCMPWSNHSLCLHINYSWRLYLHNNNSRVKWNYLLIIELWMCCIKNYLFSATNIHHALIKSSDDVNTYVVRSRCIVWSKIALALIIFKQALCNQ